MFCRDFVVFKDDLKNLVKAEIVPKNRLLLMQQVQAVDGLFVL